MRWTRAACVGALAIVMSCSDSGLTAIRGPYTSDVETARAAWLANQPSSYLFEVSFQALEWGRQGPYERVVVQDGVVTDSGNDRRMIALTIEEHWQRILEASKNGSLKSARFTMTGIPVEWLVDVDAMADDSYKVWIRSFELR